MSIKIVRPAKSRNGVKLYAIVPSSSKGGLSHIVVYLRTSTMKRWLCACHDQVFNQTGKRRNCRHIHAVRKEVGL
jgi:hypothetical protein